MREKKETHLSSWPKREELIYGPREVVSTSLGHSLSYDVSPAPSVLVDHAGTSGDQGCDAVTVLSPERNATSRLQAKWVVV
jgi:hypothetical protein